MFRHYKKYINSIFRDSQHKNLLTALKPFLPSQPATILDIGTADGKFASLIHQEMPHLTITGIDVMPREKQHIPIQLYEGKKIPFDSNTFDYAMLINVLHHTEDIKTLLKEALRICCKGIIIKDHYANSWLDNFILTTMEYANPNSRILLECHPLHFYSKSQWTKIFSDLGLTCASKAEKFTCYGYFFDIFFGRNMHFIGKYHLLDSN